MRIKFKAEDGCLTVVDIVSADEVQKIESLLGDFQEVPDRAGIVFLTDIKDAFKGEEVYYETVYVVARPECSVKEMMCELFKTGCLDCTKYPCDCI